MKPLGVKGVEVWDYGRFISLPLYHPFRLLVNVLNFTYVFVVPASYVAIYRFRL